MVWLPTEYRLSSRRITCSTELETNVEEGPKMKEEKGQWCRELGRGAVAWIIIALAVAILYVVLASSFLIFVELRVFDEKIFLAEFGGLAGSWGRMPTDAMCVFVTVLFTGMASKVVSCLLLAWAHKYHEARRRERRAVRIV